MDFIEKKTQVFQLYEEYERLVQPYKTQAVCEKGCASCCIDVGSVGATTLEGVIILEHIQGWDRQALKEIMCSLAVLFWIRSKAAASMLCAPLVADDCIPLGNVMAKGPWFTAKPLRWGRKLKGNCRT